MFSVTCITLAFLVDLLIGDPYGFPHPVRYMGRYIRFFEKKYNKEGYNKKALGFLLLWTLAILSFGLTQFVLFVAFKIHVIVYIGINILILWTCIAHKCLGNEAKKVLKRLKEEGLEGAREQIGYLVARQTDKLSEEEICKATVETVAENTSDGIIGPLFYMAIGGAPLAMMYKAVSTLDSTVGYKNKRYKEFGFYSAKCDDVLNYIPARITGVLMSIGAFILGYNGKESFRILRRDCRNHASPNAGFPESATAGALGIRLGGASVYFGKRVEKPTIGDKIKAVEGDDIKKAIHLMTVCTLLFMVILWFIAMI